jgi:hypothetical protein
VDLAQRAAEHREVLRRDEHLAAVHRAIAGDDAVAGGTVAFDPEVVGAVHGEGVGLLERVPVHEQLDALARRELALLVLLADGVLAGAVEQGRATLAELLDAVLDRAYRRLGKILGLGHDPRSLAERPRGPRSVPEAVAGTPPLSHPSALTTRIVTMVFERPDSALSFSSNAGASRS